MVSDLEHSWGRWPQNEGQCRRLIRGTLPLFLTLTGGISMPGVSVHPIFILFPSPFLVAAQSMNLEFVFSHYSVFSPTGWSWRVPAGGAYDLERLPRKTLYLYTVRLCLWQYYLVYFDIFIKLGLRFEISSVRPSFPTPVASTFRLPCNYFLTYSVPLFDSMLPQGQRITS